MYIVCTRVWRNPQHIASIICIVVFSFLKASCLQLSCWVSNCGSLLLWNTNTGTQPHCEAFYLFIWGFMSLSTLTSHITMGSWKGRGNQYIQFVRVLYCKLPTNCKTLPAFPLEAVPGTKPWPQWWEARMLPLCHRDPFLLFMGLLIVYFEDIRVRSV